MVVRTLSSALAPYCSKESIVTQVDLTELPPLQGGEALGTRSFPAAGGEQEEPPTGCYCSKCSPQSMGLGGLRGNFGT